MRLGIFAGLASATKYSGLVAPVVALALVGYRAWRAPRRVLQVRDGLLLLTIALGIGSWRYVDNIRRYETALFSNGWAQQGFSAPGNKYHWGKYDFMSLKLGTLIDLAYHQVPPGSLDDLPFYRSVLTSLYGMAWGDLSFFSDPSRAGVGRIYPPKRIPPWLASGVLLLGLIPTALAVVGAIVSCFRRSALPLLLMSLISSLVYLHWVISQEAWALKTKYLLFLVPAYLGYACFGLNAIGRWSPRLHGLVVVGLWTLVVFAHAYLFAFAVK